MATITIKNVGKVIRQIQGLEAEVALLQKALRWSRKRARAAEKELRDLHTEVFYRNQEDSSRRSRDVLMDSVRNLARRGR